MSLHLISGQICLAAAVVVIVYDLNVAARQYPGTGYAVHIVIISMFHPVSRRMRYTANGSGSGRKKPKPTATATASWLSQLAVSRSFSIVETTTQANCRYDPDGRSQYSLDKRDIFVLPRLIHRLYDLSDLVSDL